MVWKMLCFELTFKQLSALIEPLCSMMIHILRFYWVLVLIGCLDYSQQPSCQWILAKWICRCIHRHIPERMRSPKIGWCESLITGIWAHNPGATGLKCAKNDQAKCATCTTIQTLASSLKQWHTSWRWSYSGLWEKGVTTSLWLSLQCLRRKLPHLRRRAAANQQVSCTMEACRWQGANVGEQLESIEVPSQNWCANSTWRHSCPTDKQFRCVSGCYIKIITGY